MNITAKILDKMRGGHGLIDVICELVEASDAFDYYDVADIVKENPTMLAQLKFEFQRLDMLDKPECDLNLTEIFKDM